MTKNKENYLHKIEIKNKELSFYLILLEFEVESRPDAQ